MEAGKRTASRDGGDSGALVATKKQRTEEKGEKERAVWEKKVRASKTKACLRNVRVERTLTVFSAAENAGDIEDFEAGCTHHASHRTPGAWKNRTWIEAGETCDERVLTNRGIGRNLRNPVLTAR